MIENLPPVPNTAIDHLLFHKSKAFCNVKRTPAKTTNHKKWLPSLQRQQRLFTDAWHRPLVFVSPATQYNPGIGFRQHVPPHRS